MGVGHNGEAEAFGGDLNRGIEAGALGAVDLYFERSPKGWMSS
jgi:hypothetical protein